MSRVFISHSSRNNAHALALAKWLDANGWSDCFLDFEPARGIASGSRWQAALKQAAHRCEVILCLISPDWCESSWCQAEYLLATQLGKVIFATTVEATPLELLPAGLTSEWQMCDLVAGSDRQWFEVELDPIVPRTKVGFAGAGLARLRVGLTNAGVDASTFAWPPATDPNRSPYRGLRALEPEDAAIFLGRDAAIVRALDALRSMREQGVERLLVVLGASGAGKSSFLRAGLLPRLERDYRRFLPLPVVRPARGALSGPSGLAASLETAFRTLNSPTAQGEILHRLAQPSGLSGLLLDLQRLARVADDREETAPTIVICLDQAEELATVEGRDQAETFMAVVVDGLNPPSSSHDAPSAHPLAILVVGIRSDSFERFQVEPHVQGIQSRLFNLPPIPPSEFKSVIEGPAERSTAAGRKLVLEPALTERLLQETQGQDALPLVAFTLERLYLDHGADGDLLLSEYEAMGGVRGSLEAAVAAAFADPDRTPAIPPDKLERENRLRRAFIPWLAMIDPETGERRRRAAYWAELPADGHALLNRMIEARLLVRDVRRLDSGDGEAVAVEVTHEALLRQWAPLVTWLDADADALKSLDAARRAASEWQRNARADGWLAHSGERLISAEAVRKRPDFDRLLGREGAEYLEACRRRDDAVRNERLAQLERVARAQRWASVLLAGIAVVIVVAGARTIAQSRNVSRQTSLALAIESERANDAGLFDQGLRLGILASRKGWLSPSVPQAEAQLARAAFASRQIALLRLDKPARVAMFGPDDTRVLTASDDGVARIWDAASGNELARFTHGAAITNAVLSPDGRRLLTLDVEDEPQLWEVATGEHIAALRHGDRVFAAAFSVDGRRLVTGGDESTVHVWDAMTGAELMRLKQGRSVFHTVFSPDGSRVAAASNDANAYMWAADTGEERLRLKHDGPVSAIEFSTDGQLLATSSGTRVRVWRSDDGEEVGGFVNPDGIQSVRFTPAGRLLVVGAGSVRIVDPLRGDAFANFRHEGFVRSAVVSPDGTRLVTSSDDKSARVWDANSGRELARLNHEGPVHSAAFDAAGRRVVTTSDLGGRIWDVVEREPMMMAVQHGPRVAAVAFSPDGHRVATASDDNTARLWDLDANREVQALAPVQGVVFSADGERLLTWAFDGSVRVWDRDGRPVAMKVHGSVVWRAALSPDGRRVISAGNSDRSAWVWDAATGKDVLELNVGGALASAAFSADRTTIVTGSRATPSQRGVARLWDAATGRMIADLPHFGSVESAVFSPDMRRVLTASSDWSVRLWNVVDGRKVWEMKHDGSVERAVFSPDGRYALSSSALDKTARLWDAGTGREVFRFSNAPTNISARAPQMTGAYFSADGYRIVTRSTDAMVRIWDTATGKELAQLRHSANVLTAELKGDRLATYSFDHVARIWNVGSLALHDNDLIASVCAQRSAPLRITPEDVKIAPLLSGRVGDDVCRD